MTLNPTLLAMLACPSDDHAPLREEGQGDAEVLVCTFCATSYPVLDGIPVLLLDDATPGPNGVGVAAGGQRVSPRHASPDIDTDPKADTATGPDPADGTDGPTTPPTGRRPRTAALRDRVQQRLTELEATRGPRTTRRDR